MEKIKWMYGMPKLMDPQRMDRCGHTAAKPDGRPALWCNFDKKWGNYTTIKWYGCITFMRN